MRAYDECKAQGLDFADAFRFQFLLHKGVNIPAEVADTLPSHTLGGWTILHGPGLEASTLLDARGTEVGLLLGFGVAPEGLVTDRHVIPDLAADATPEAFDAALHHWLEYLGGRYALVILPPSGGPRFYVDPGAMIGAVYDPVCRTVGATLGITLFRPICTLDLFDPEAVRTGKQRYGLFHTADAYVKRLNPSCWLDLETFVEHRFWPGDTPLVLDDDARAEAYRTMTRLTAGVLGALPQDREIWFGFSGGQDSRLLAALVHPHLSRPGLCAYTHIHSYSSRIDAEIGRRLAERAGLEHRVLDKRSTPRNVRERRRAARRFRVAAGMQIPVPREIQYQLQSAIPKGAVILRGHLTDTLRAHFLPPRETAINDRNAISRLGLVPREDFDDEAFRRFAPFYHRWLDGVPASARSHFFDLLFIEAFFPAGWGPVFPAMCDQFYLAPFNVRHNLRLAISLPFAVRKSSEAVNDLIEINAPALATIPFDYELRALRLSLDQMDAPRLARRVRARVRKTRRRLADLGAEEGVA